MEPSGNAMFRGFCKAMVAVLMVECVHPGGINGHKVVFAKETKMAQHLLLEEAAHKLGFELLHEFGLYCPHNLIDGIGMGQPQFKMTVLIFGKNGIAPVIVVRIARSLFKKVHEQRTSDNFPHRIPGSFPIVFQAIKQIKKFRKTLCDNAFNAGNDNFALFGSCGFFSWFSQ